MLNLAFLANSRAKKFPVITAITFCPQERELVSGCENGEIFVWNSDQYDFSQKDIKLRIIPSVIQNLSRVTNLRIIDKSVLHYMNDSDYFILASIYKSLYVFALQDGLCVNHSLFEKELVDIKLLKENTSRLIILATKKKLLVYDMWKYRTMREVEIMNVRIVNSAKIIFTSKQMIYDLDLSSLSAPEFAKYSEYIKNPNKNTFQFQRLLKMQDLVQREICSKTFLYEFPELQIFIENEKVELKFENVTLLIDFCNYKEKIQKLHVIEYVEGISLFMIILDNKGNLFVIDFSEFFEIFKCNDIHKKKFSIVEDYLILFKEENSEFAYLTMEAFLVTEEKVQNFFTNEFFSRIVYVENSGSAHFVEKDKLRRLPRFRYSFKEPEYENKENEWILYQDEERTLVTKLGYRTPLLNLRSSQIFTSELMERDSEFDVIESGFLNDGEPVSFYATGNKIIAKTLCQRNSIFFTPVPNDANESEEISGMIELAGNRKITTMLWESQSLLFVSGIDESGYFVSCFWINRRNSDCSKNLKPEDRLSNKIRVRSFANSNPDLAIKEENSTLFLKEKGIETKKENYFFSIVFEESLLDEPSKFIPIKEFRRISEISDRCNSETMICLHTLDGKIYIFSKRGLQTELNGIYNEPFAVLNDHYYSQIIVFQENNTLIFSFPDGMKVREIELDDEDKKVCKMHTHYYSYKDFKEKVKPVSRLHTILDYQIYRMKAQEGGLHSDFRQNSHKINDAEIVFTHCNKKLEVFKFLASNPMRNGISLVKSSDSSIILVEGERAAELMSFGMKLIQRSVQLNTDYSFGLIGVDSSITFLMNMKKPWEHSKRLATIIMIVTTVFLSSYLACQYSSSSFHS